MCSQPPLWERLAREGVSPDNPWFGLKLIVPTLCVGMHPVTLCVTCQKRNAERPW
ncbi:hypothetical protein SAMN05660640_03030, partial [Pseudomonas sp. NFACC16-2]